MKRLMKIDNKVEYIVGYKRPPKDTQFKKGKSGNPKGRPKGSQNKKPKVCTTFNSLIIDAANEVVESSADGEVVALTVAQSIIKSISEAAMAGNSRAQTFFIKMLQQAEQEERKEQEECFAAAREYKERAFQDVTEDGRHLSEEDPKYLPHPDDIKIDTRTGDVTFSGPINEEDKEYWDNFWRLKRVLEKRLSKIGKIRNGRQLKSSELENLLDITYNLEVVEQAIATRWDIDLDGLISDADRREKVRGRIKQRIIPEL